MADLQGADRRDLRAAGAAPRGASHGALAAVQGFRFALHRPEIRRLYRRLAVVLFVVTLLLIGGLSALLWHFTAASHEASALRVVALWLLRLGGLAVVGLSAPLLALLGVNAAWPALSEQVFMAALKELDPARAEGLAAAPGASLKAGLATALRRLGYFFVMTLVAFGAALVPIVGVIAGPLLQGYVSARAITWELLDPYFDRRGLDFARQQAEIRAQRWAVLGFGLPMTLLLAIPLVGPLLFGFAQAAAAKFVVDVLPRDELT